MAVLEIIAGRGARLLEESRVNASSIVFLESVARDLPKLGEGKLLDVLKPLRDTGVSGISDTSSFFSGGWKIRGLGTAESHIVESNIASAKAGLLDNLGLSMGDPSRAMMRISREGHGFGYQKNPDFIVYAGNENGLGASTVFSNAQDRFYDALKRGNLLRTPDSSTAASNSSLLNLRSPQEMYYRFAADRRPEIMPQIDVLFGETEKLVVPLQGVDRFTGRFNHEGKVYEPINELAFNRFTLGHEGSLTLYDLNSSYALVINRKGKYEWR